MIWWYWILMGLAFLSVEILTPGGFYLLFFGVSAIVVGVVVGWGWGELLWFQWVLFALLSIVSVLLFRGPLLAKIKLHTPDDHPIDTLVGETVILMEDLLPNGVGKAELRGTTWNVRNADSIALCKGQRSRVGQVEGLTLWIKAE